VKKNNEPVPGALSVTIKQFCKMVPMSEATYVRLKRAGQAPREMRLLGRGGGIRISLEAARAWVKAREKAAR